MSAAVDGESPEYDYDLFVIGAGSGGVRTARMASAKGLRVAVAEEKYLGGTCVNVGCVPKKLMVYASHFSDDFEDAAGFGWKVGAAEHDWSTLIARKDAEISRLNGIYKNMLESAGVTIITGRARFVNSHTVSINGENISAEKILIAVGGTPYLPEFPGSEHVISSDQVFYLSEKPNSILVVGGGYIAVEFAGIFNGLGAKTQLLYRGEQLLRVFDKTIADFAIAEIAKKGVDIRYQTQIIEIIKQDDGRLQCKLNNGDTVLADQVMVATGRSALTQDLGLENTRVSLTQAGHIQADKYNFSTGDDAIFALGDVIGTPELTPVALAQAMVFLDQQYGSGKRQMSYDAIATAVFCQPNIGTVGLSEEQAAKLGGAIDVYQSEFRHLKHTLSGSDERVLMKLIVDQASQVVLGVHMVGPDAGEIIQGFAVAVKAKLTKALMDETIGIHPTAAEEFVTLREIKHTVA
ncbi:MAG: glutathione-disulfide reductase [Pseudomonadales bacterium]|nr:glutathione-disulfide reductase [Pseudomonadales bacterium]